MYLAGLHPLVGRATLLGMARDLASVRLGHLLVRLNGILSVT